MEQEKHTKIFQSITFRKSNAWTSTLWSVALLPCFHMVRCSIINAWYRQKDCMECLECSSWGHQHLCRNNPRSEQSHTRLAAFATSWVLDCALIYTCSKNCDAELLNDAMKDIFTHSLKSLDSISPTQHALFQHAKRVLLAAAFIWKQSLSKIPKIPKPSDWVGNGTPGPISGYHSGQIWQMSATHVHCSSIVVVSWHAGAIVSAIELDSDAAHSANVKGATQTMTMNYDLACSLI